MTNAARARRNDDLVQPQIADSDVCHNASAATAAEPTLRAHGPGVSRIDTGYSDNLTQGDWDEYFLAIEDVAYYHGDER